MPGFIFECLLKINPAYNAISSSKHLFVPQLEVYFVRSSVVLAVKSDL